MDTLRKFLKWIDRHRFISLSGAGLLVVTIMATKAALLKSEGVLSNPIERGSIIRSVYGIGTVVANHTFQIKPGVTTTIRELFVKEGDSVNKGDKLVSIDSVIYRAPFSGTVTNLPFKPGENLFLGAPVLTLADLSDRYLLVSLEQQGALRVMKGQAAKLSFDTVRQDTYDGVVQSVYSFNGNFLARIDVSKFPKNILPDMTADVAIAIREHKNVITVPIAALDNGTVWVKREYSLPKAIPVKTGIVDAVAAEIVSGDIQPGDRVLIKKRLSP